MTQQHDMILTSLPSSSDISSTLSSTLTDSVVRNLEPVCVLISKYSDIAFYEGQNTIEKTSPGLAGCGGVPDVDGVGLETVLLVVASLGVLQPVLLVTIQLHLHPDLTAAADRGWNYYS